MYQSIVASGLQKLGVQVSSLGVPAVKYSVSPVEGIFSPYFNVTDVTLTKNRNKNTYYFSKVHNCQLITSGRCVALFFNVTDVTLTENRNKYKFFSKVHNCQCILN